MNKCLLFYLYYFWSKNKVVSRYFFLIYIKWEPSFFFVIASVRDDIFISMCVACLIQRLYLFLICSCHVFRGVVFAIVLVLFLYHYFTIIIVYSINLYNNCYCIFVLLYITHINDTLKWNNYCHLGSIYPNIWTENVGLRYF